MRRCLCPYEFEEVQKVIFSLKSDKSPGINGFNIGFYQQHWDIIGPNISADCINYLHHNNFPQTLNKTLLILIPKKTSPESMDLCNVVYKIMSKMIFNHLRNILPSNIS